MRNILLLILLIATTASAQIMGPRKQASRFASDTILTGTLTRSETGGLELRTSNARVPVQLGAMQRDRVTARAIESSKDVRLKGRMVQHRGKTFLLVREITMSGQTFVIRNANDVSFRAPEVRP